MNDDLSELLVLLNSHGVDYLVIGAHAVAFYGTPRFTVDIDLWVDRAAGNASRLGAALTEFGTPIGESGVKKFSLQDREMIRLGAPPQMVDILNFAGDVPFEEVWGRKESGQLIGVPVQFPSREDLIAMKRIAGRPQDLADIAGLELEQSR